MTTVTLRKLGGSVVMTVPKKILHFLGAGTGSQLDLRAANGKLILEPRRKPKYTLAELLKKCNSRNMALTPEDRKWLRGKPVGKELI